MSWRKRRELSTEAAFTRYCPETGDEVDVEVTLCGTWMPGEPGNLYDPPIPAGVEDVWTVANGQDFEGGEFGRLTLRERDWAAELLAGEVES